jgi:hypothetical protein
MKASTGRNLSGRAGKRRRGFSGVGCRGVNRNTRPKTEGMGRISGRTRGVNAHSCLAASAEGLVLGVLDQTSYNRAESNDETAGRESKKARPIEGRESFRRLKTLGRSAADVPKGARAAAACDREGDMADKVRWLVRQSPIVGRTGAHKDSAKPDGGGEQADVRRCAAESVPWEV